jgi:hypothetical protein
MRGLACRYGELRIMKNSIVLKTILVLSGLVASGIGASILISPSSFCAGYGIALGSNASLFNEIRAPGGALLASGILIISGAIVDKLAFTAALIAALLYLSYGLSRAMSIAVDGMPSEGLILAAAFEITTGLVCVFALVRYREKGKRYA